MIDERRDVGRCTMPRNIDALQIPARRFVRVTRQSHSYHPLGEAAKHTLCRMIVCRAPAPEQAEHNESKTHGTAEQHRKSDSCWSHFSQ